MPPHEPSTPDTDGFANIRFTPEGMTLELADGRVEHIPSRTIHKGSMVIKPGSDTQVNIVQLELLAGEVEVQSGSYPAEFRIEEPLLGIPVIADGFIDGPIVDA